ncbi:MAG TPA: pyruvate kinase alpha/beta domain-containing protein [Mesotoga infera]|mgnify:FL=1|jgi:hypothetical protein|nr:hypothetical protein [Mesotoga sp.]NLI06313.1 hypothetical protein [Thermotogaceae bacterium]HOI34219.1 pyruvate kinase alpha/beta domain-containing protein [Mesotoga infera]HON27472.1 pyruvate kinase alpha/beta domain-containing protein [Mesotoga infera]HPD38383.1 pyruvate kinase alpha/beta domain-containing protein [Mesotoga infera]
MVIYFKKSDEETTKTLLEHIFTSALKRNIRDIVLPSTLGNVAKLAFETVPSSLRLVIVTHSVGFKKTDHDEFDPQVRKMYYGSRHAILTATHLFRGLDGAFYKSSGGTYPPQIFATALRLFGQGTKVAIEIAMMAADSGLVSVNDWIISAGGTGHGIDTAYILKTCHSSDLGTFKFGELLGIPSTLELTDS